MLHPIFEEASNIVREEYPDATQVVFARVDCDQHCEFIYTHTHIHTHIGLAFEIKQIK